LELTIAMIIISLLIGIGIVTFISAQRSGRDSTRQADLRKISNALEQYYSDNHEYPSAGDCSGTWADVADISSALSSYVEVVPTDPSSGDSYYYCRFAGPCYCLVGGMEVKDGQSEGDCGGSGYTTGELPSGTNGYYLTCP